MTHLVWFRKDLRILDNPALFAASQRAEANKLTANEKLTESTKLLAVFFITEQQWQQHGMGQRQIQLLKNAVLELQQSLRSLNIPLLIINAGDFNNSLTLLQTLCSDLNIDQVFFNHEYELNEQQRDKRFSHWCDQNQITTHGFHDQCLVPPGKVLTASDTMFKVYSPFKRAWQKQVGHYQQPPLGKPAAADHHNIGTDLNGLDLPLLTLDYQPDELWQVAEAAAHQQLNDFLDQRVQDYHELRDIPSQPATSQLSMALALGLLSPRQCFYACWQHSPGELYKSRGELIGAKPGLDSWINELIWREFYRHLMVAYPDLCKHKAFKPDTEQVPWRYDQADFQAWCDGNTGYPIVDAAMRQLKQTGWMHNRLRMISAMFLTKHLLIDWRWGEAWFAEHLVDFDLASNNGGWQWSASTGADGAPYFRIFNPTSQSQKFDSEGHFIVRYVPELLPLDPKQRHAPDNAKRRFCHYPQPVVDHQFGRQRALAAFKGEPLPLSACEQQKQTDLFSPSAADEVSNESI
ncbi:deoxyribodipyrimidine photo-lyase [Bacterioplanoides sp.]|uniref:deoxyribodipyrimidine photo-lyase n=1 Tax=Bacterioplanoides sp. TaxID=2066072 RepID=UPI003B006412